MELDLLDYDLIGALDSFQFDVEYSSVVEAVEMLGVEIAELESERGVSKELKKVKDLISKYYGSVDLSYQLLKVIDILGVLASLQARV